MCVQQKLQKNRNQLQDIDLYIFFARMSLAQII